LRQPLTLIGILVLAAAALWYSLAPPQFTVKAEANQEFKVPPPPSLGLDLRGGLRVTLEPDDTKPGGANVTEEQMRQVREVLEHRVNSFGLSGADVRVKSGAGGRPQVPIHLPGVKDPEAALKTIQTVAQLQFQYLANVRSKKNISAPYRMDVLHGDPAKGEGDNYTFTDSAGKNVPQEQVLKDPANVIVVGGSHLKPVSKAEIDISNGQPEVTFEFDQAGAKAFGDFTTAHVDETLAVVLDNKIISAPNINTPIT